MTPQPREYRGSVTCDSCGCDWVALNINRPNPHQDWCKEPERQRPDKLGCGCHSWSFLRGYLDEVDRRTEAAL